MKKLSAFIALSLLATTSSAYAQTCASATEIFSNQSYDVDTTATTNWLTSFGPVVSPSNDALYKFTAGLQPLEPITPTASNYAFAMYLIPSCSDSGTEPVPIGSTATLNTGIATTGLTAGTTYFLAVTGTAAGGPGANGTTTFTTGRLPVALQSFEVN
jgi:hypothetical protein